MLWSYTILSVAVAPLILAVPAFTVASSCHSGAITAPYAAKKQEK
jgi:hypothetical protein